MSIQLEAVSTESDMVSFLISELKGAITRVRRARKWHLVSPLSRAFASACLMMKLKKIKSITLIKAIIKTIKELKGLISREYKLIQLGIKYAWKVSMLASSWGHPNAENWKHDKSFIILQALTLKWLSRLFGKAILDTL